VKKNNSMGKIAITKRNAAEDALWLIAPFANPLMKNIATSNKGMP
jgi:uncharacterized protein (UPF0333 family)